MRTKINPAVWTTLGGAVLAFVVGVASADTPRTSADPAPKGELMAFTLTSPSFSSLGSIPSLHTCEGTDVPPALAWSGLPPGTRSLALVVDDPDAPDPRAPKMTF